MWRTGRVIRRNCNELAELPKAVVPEIHSWVVDKPMRALAHASRFRQADGMCALDGRQRRPRPLSATGRRARGGHQVHRRTSRDPVGARRPGNRADRPRVAGLRRPLRVCGTSRSTRTGSAWKMCSARRCVWSRSGSATHGPRWRSARCRRLTSRPARAGTRSPGVVELDSQSSCPVAQIDAMAVISPRCTAISSIWRDGAAGQPRD